MTTPLMRKAVLVLLSLFGLALGSQALAEAARDELLIYCGITMLQPMSEIARVIELEQKVKITISQGASGDLYQSLKASRAGDLYLPGDPEFRTKNLKEGLLGEYVTLGYNQAALLVRKGNPKRVKPDVRELLRDDLAVVIGSPERGAIGVETKQVLERAGIYEKVVDRALFLAPDSRNLNNALKRGEADVIVNFRATAFFPDNAGIMEALDLDPKLAVPQPLWLSLLTFSRNPALARRFMDYAASAPGQAIFRKYGFLDNHSVAPQQ